MSHSQVFANAKSENEKFGVNAEMLYSVLSVYQLGDPVPTEFWESYKLLSNAIDTNENGLILSKLQTECMAVIKNLMREKGLLVVLPDSKTIKKKIKKATREFSYNEFLENQYIPVLLTKANQDMDIHFFISLIRKVRINVRSWRNASPPQLETDLAVIEQIASNFFPPVLVDAFVENKDLATYAKNFLESTRVNPF